MQYRLLVVAGLLRPIVCGLAVAAAGLSGATPLAGAEAQWIWSPAYEKEQAPVGNCYFRKTFAVGSPEQGEIKITCDDHYELYVNGRQVGVGDSWKKLDIYDISKFLVQGTNTVAIKAMNRDGNSAGLAAQVTVKQQGNTHIAYSSDASWKTALKEFPNWQKTRFTDTQWLAARSFGPLGSTLPWGNEVVSNGQMGRFKVLPEFQVEWVIDPKETGSLIAMTFDEFGQIIASRENGPLILIRDENKDGLLDSVTTLCDELKNCQGVLSVSGKIFAVGQGPQGPALYRLSDEDRDGKTDKVDALLKFTGEMGEHGPHSLVLGPDGLLYIVLGNFSHPEKSYESTSPYHHFYEGDLVTPRYEDATGHAVGVKAPGGTIIRTDTSGSAVELVAGGLQNPYDIAFSGDGELFTSDSDMEWDSGMPWYRPTRFNHVTPGAEFGWRSGWAKWPEYYADSLPATLELGRGSPTGVEAYNHVMYPQRFHKSLFVCDWSRGRILSIRTKPQGGSYTATAETFLEGRPLNVTDAAVGPDGWLYFCTGGRDTEGGVYRVVWEGKVPANLLETGRGLMAAIRQPQINSAWGRQKVALIKQQMGKRWAVELTALIENPRTTLDDRARALELMQLFGPHPSKKLLVALSQQRHSALRLRATYLMGIHADKTTQARLVALLGDSDPAVQRVACESLVRADQEAPVPAVLRALGSLDRHVSSAARRVLQKMPREQWEPEILEAEQPKVFLGGALALLALDVETPTVEAILQRSSKLMEQYLTDGDFIDLLRVVELTLARGEVPPESVTGLRRQLVEEYPAKDPHMNRELVRILAYLQEPAAAERFVKQLSSDAPTVEKLHVALHTRFLHAGWTPPLKLAVLKYFEEARTLAGGHSYVGYLENISRDFFAGLTEEERARVLEDGAKWPTSALSVLAKLPEHPSPETLRQIEALDREAAKLDTEAARRLRIGIAAVLGASHDEQAMAYLREIFEKEPARRVAIAMGLAQQPEGENWPLLVRSLSFVEGSAAQEVLIKLAEVDRKPKQPEPYRQVILRGLLLRENGGQHAVALLEHWTGEKLSQSSDPWNNALREWQAWFTKTYPDEPAPKLPTEVGQNNWTYQELLGYLSGSQAALGDSGHGSSVFVKAQCSKCHRYGDRGERVGPDLTTVSQRFQRKEILESILFPSHVISDQYATQTVVTTNGRIVSGMVSPVGNGSLVVLTSKGEKVIIAEDEVEDRKRSNQSSMPAGLLNPLTLDEIADLFAYISKPAAAAQITSRPRAKRK